MRLSLEIDLHFGGIEGIETDFDGLAGQMRRGFVEASVLLNLCFFARREDFSCRLGELIELIDAGPGGRQNSYENGTSGFGDVITMGARYLLD